MLKTDKENEISLATRALIGLMFACSGIYMVVSNNYNEALIVFLSVFAFGYWVKS